MTNRLFRLQSRSVQVNHGAAGVFRIHYDEPMRKALLLAIRNKSLSPMNRFILHSDLLALVRSRREQELVIIQ